MKPKEQFALVLRVLAVLGLVYVFRSVIRHPVVAAHTEVARVVAVVIGLYLLRGAPALLRFAYPECQCSETPEKPAG